MKGTYPQDELETLPSGCLEKVVSLDVPMLGAQRHAVFLNPPAAANGDTRS
jgi:hypothetical protein